MADVEAVRLGIIAAEKSKLTAEADSVVTDPTLIAVLRQQGRLTSGIANQLEQLQSKGELTSLAVSEALDQSGAAAFFGRSSS